MMRGWSFDLGLSRVWNSILERNPSRQLVRKHVSQQVEVANSLKDNVFVDSSNLEHFEHFTRAELFQGEDSWQLYSDTDVQ